MRRAAPALLLPFLLLADDGARAADPSPTKPAVEVRLELAEGAVYEKGPFQVRLVFVNGAEPRLTIPASAFEPGAFTLLGKDGRPARPAKTLAPQAASPLELDGYLTTSHTVDLTGWYERPTAKKASWTLSWRSGSLSAAPIPVRVIRAHDPRKDRRAIVRTDLGIMTWELMPGIAPVHVKRFVDLVRLGYYDGLTIYRVIPGVQAEGGDPKGDGTGGWERLLRPEISTSVRPAIGLVGALRQETSMTSDTLFFITLAPNEFMMGKQTFYARVTKGIEIVGRLNRVPTTGETGLKGEFLTTPPVRIHRMQIR